MVDNPLSIQEAIEWGLLVAQDYADDGEEIGNERFVHEVEWARTEESRVMLKLIRAHARDWREEHYAKR